MAKSSMKQALGASMSAESAAFAGRLARAEAQLERGNDAAPSEAVANNAIANNAIANNAMENNEMSLVPKVVREAFTIPEVEHGQIEQLRLHMLGQAMAVSKSEIVRAGLLLLAQADETKRRAAFEQLERVKTGRPKTTVVTV